MGLLVQTVERVLANLSRSSFVMTASHEGRRCGVCVRWVCACADEPLLISVALRRGHWIVPLIRDSHAFGLCSVDASDRLIALKFGENVRARDGDQFDAIGADRLASGAPALRRSEMLIDCQMSRLIDLEADHQLYIGQVMDVRFPPMAFNRAADRVVHSTVAERAT